MTPGPACPAFPGDLPTLEWCEQAKGEWCVDCRCGRVKRSGKSLYQVSKELERKVKNER